MANLRAIRAHIKSIESTRKITKSMKLVAAAKLKRMQSAMNDYRPYADACRDMLAPLLSLPSAAGRPLLEKREVRRICYVLFVGNRGLCGVYNTALLKYMESRAERNGADEELLVCGRWGGDLIAETGLKVIDTLTDVGDSPGAEDGRRICGMLREMFLSGRADEIVLVYESYVSALSQVPTMLRLLPLEPAEGPAEDRPIFEPCESEVFDTLADMYLESAVCSVLFESKTAEHTARMSAMTAASDNTEQMIAQLELELNHARQAAITTEIAEIVGGANAIENS